MPSQANIKMALLQGYQAEIMEECISLALDASKDSEVSGIAALIAKDGVIVARSVNTVMRNCNPVRHAEVNAITAACDALNVNDLSGYVLYSSLQPCEMCLAATLFSGIRTVFFAGQKANVGEKYFMFPGLNLSDFQTAAKSSFHAQGGFLEDKVIPLYADGDE